MALQTTQAVAERAIGLIGQVIAPTARTPSPSSDSPPSDRRTPDRARDARPASTPDTQEGPVDPRSQAEPAAETVALETREPEPRESDEDDSASVPEPPEPDHVSEEAVVVEEVAEPGAEDGAGAQIRVAEPWDGYAEMKAPDIIDRINGLGAAELAAVELYELSHRERQTVIEAVTRQLRRTQNPAQ